jgi:lipopolysaccharide assembly outer membrane protein LptD (OstA)
LFKFNKLLLIIFIIVTANFEISYAKIIITGTVMKITEGGHIIVSKGQSQIIQNNNIFRANLILYNRYRNSIVSYGKIDIHLQIQKDEFIEAQGEQAQFCFNRKIGKLVGGTQQVIIKYFKKNLIMPYCTLYSDQLYFDQNTLEAYNNVKVVTKYGFIRSNNAFFNNNCAIFKSDKNRPTADILYNNMKIFCKANEILFSFENNKIIMKGNIKCTIKT